MTDFINGIIGFVNGVLSWAFGLVNTYVGAIIPGFELDVPVIGELE